MNKQTIIRIKNITKTYNNTTVLNDINLDVNDGEILAIMGPSGSGKSTLLHTIAGILTPSTGEVYYGDTRIDNLNDTQRTILRRTDFGFVFQFSQLVPELTAHDNVAVPLLLGKTPHNRAYADARMWLEEVGLGDKLDTLPGELSGGEAQRVAIARAMVIRPKVIFADEPTGSLDSINSEHVMELFIKTAKENGTTVLVVTHEPNIAAYADREIIVRDGKIVGCN